MTDIPRSYAEARDLYEDRRQRGILDRGIRLANNTHLTWQDETKPVASSGLVPSPSWFGVRLHKTNVVTFHSDGSIVLDSGGWKTVTTKDRMNRALPEGWSVYSDRGVWYLDQRGAKDGMVTLVCHGGYPIEDYPGHTIRPRWFYDSETKTHGKRPEASPYRWTATCSEIYDLHSPVLDCPKCGKRAGYVGPPTKTYVYADGIYIDTQTKTAHGEGEDPKAQKELRRRAHAYAKAYVTALYAGKIPAPSGGDCWGCLMVPADGSTPGPQDGLGGRDHMLSHLEERYYVPSLVLRALKRFGGSQAAYHDLALIWDTEGRFEDSPIRLWNMQEQIHSAIRRHVCEQLGLGA